MKHSFHLILSILLTTAAHAAFNDIGTGARPLALGGAFVALADDSNAAGYNAAGLAYIDTPVLGATYTQHFSGLVTYNGINAVLPLNTLGALGAGFGQLSEDSGIYQEQTLRLSYANAFVKQFGLGANLKLFRTAFDETNEFVAENPYFTQTTTSAASLDIGAIAKPLESLTLGISVENILPADISISETETDAVPLNIRAGLVYRLASIAEMSTQGAAVSNILQGSLATFEIAARDGDTAIRAGIEVWLNNSIAIRGGYNVQNGIDTATTLSLGGSAKLPISGRALQLDYGVQLLSGDLQNSTTQRFSLNLLL